MTIRYIYTSDATGPEGAVHTATVHVNGLPFGRARFGLATVRLETYRGARLFGSEGELEDWVRGAI